MSGILDILDITENNKLFENFLNDLFFKKYNKKKIKTYPSAIELYVTSDCNYNCEYCYLARNGDFLYPKEIRSHQIILNNLKMFLKWLIKNNYQLDSLDLFSGEFFANDLGFLILEEILEASIKMPGLCKEVCIPSNFSFIRNDKKVREFEILKQKFNNNNMQLFLSCSVDGKPIDQEARATKGDEWRDKEYYDKLFKFVKKHNFGFHPMIGKSFLDNYKENYTWWVDQIIKYDLTDKHGYYHLPMFLEVRDDFWNDIYLQKYANLIEFMFELDLNKYHNNDIKNFAYRLFHVPNTNSIKDVNDINKLPFFSKRLSCSIQRGPVIRLGDLSFIPCHRTSYPKFIYGNFKIENNEIIGIEAKNVHLAMKIFSLNPNISHPKCSSCPIKYICMRGCLGAQYEYSKEMFAPIPSVCNLMYTKFNTLNELYKKYNMYQIILQDPAIPKEFKQRVRTVEKILNNFKEQQE